MLASGFYCMSFMVASSFFVSDEFDAGDHCSRELLRYWTDTCVCPRRGASVIVDSDSAVDLTYALNDKSTRYSFKDHHQALLTYVGLLESLYRIGV